MVLFLSDVFSPVELTGYAAMILVAVSLAVGNMKWLRILNMSGAIVFIVYGALIDSVPVVLLNAFLTVVNLYHLLKIIKGRY